MDFSTETLESLGREAKARIDNGDKAQDRAEQLYISAGLYLIEAKTRVLKTKGITWPQWLQQNVKRAPSTCDRYIGWANGTSSYEEHLEVARQRDAKTRAAARAHQESTSPSLGKSSEKPQQKQRTTSSQSAKAAVNEAVDEATQHHADLLRETVALVKKLNPEQLEALNKKLKELV